MFSSPIIIGIAGGTGSGKTTLANELSGSLNGTGISVIHHDAYYHDQSHVPFEQRAKINFDHPDSLETDLLIDHLNEIIEGREVEIPVYDFATHTRKEVSRIINPQPVVILEGVLILAEEKLRGLIGVKIYVDTDDDVRLIRRLQRDMRERGRSFDSVAKQYLETVRPMHIKFVEPSKRYADLVVSGEDHTAADRVISMIQQKNGNHHEAHQG